MLDEFLNFFNDTVRLNVSVFEHETKMASKKMFWLLYCIQWRI